MKTMVNVLEPCGEHREFISYHMTVSANFSHSLPITVTSGPSFPVSDSFSPVSEIKAEWTLKLAHLCYLSQGVLRVHPVEEERKQAACAERWTAVLTQWQSTTWAWMALQSCDIIVQGSAIGRQLLWLGHLTWGKHLPSREAVLEGAGSQLPCASVTLP